MPVAPRYDDLFRALNLGRGGVQWAQLGLWSGTASPSVQISTAPLTPSRNGVSAGDPFRFPTIPGRLARRWTGVVIRHVASPTGVQATSSARNTAEAAAPRVSRVEAWAVARAAFDGVRWNRRSISSRARRAAEAATTPALDAGEDFNIGHSGF